MDKLLKYEKLIMGLLQEYVKDWSSGPELTFQTAFDKENHHYQIIAQGWVNAQHVHFSPVHFDIINGKIWLQRNTTEEYPAERLVALGVPKTDIVLGVLPPAVRKFSEYAAA
jgi:XisI protein